MSIICSYAFALRGAPFPRAWKIAMRKTHPNAKIYLSLKETKPEWKAAYEGLPVTSREDAVARLAGWLDVAADRDVVVAADHDVVR